MSFPWTKFQDFYLRLGFLKVLTCALDPSRRSALNQSIERRLAIPLFEPVTKYAPLWDRVKPNFPKEETKLPSKKQFTTVAEALLFDGDCPSVLYAITPETSYKILDWGHDVHLVGRGNQISERALVLRALLPGAVADQFFNGDVDAWNPFVMTTAEKLFFLYHLGEIDETTIDLIDGLALRHEQSALEAAEASRLLCEAMFALLSRSEQNLLPRETPQFRTALDLACVIADELGVKDFAQICGANRSLRKIGKAGVKRSGLSRLGEHTRRTTKSADHQTIPRFEQLTDLGFVRKNDPEIADVFSARKRWRYIPTDASRQWRSAHAANLEQKRNFWWYGFAKTAVRTFALGSSENEAGNDVIARYLWRAYEKIRRPMGHTPFDSVALLAMIYAAIDGIAIEISAFHRLMLAIKQGQFLPDHAFFASGNEIDKMFILLKPGFTEALAPVLGALGEGSSQ